MQTRKALLYYMRQLMLLIVACCMAASCYYSHPNKVDHWQAASETGVDSVNFFITHHYWTGYNFVATDTLTLQTAPHIEGLPDYGALLNDTVCLTKHDPLVVAKVMYVPTDTTDSVWVKVARDQLSQGWVHESELLRRVVPDDPISKFIFYFSDSRSVYVLSVLGLAIVFLLVQNVRHKRFRMVHFNDIPSFYPTLLCLCVSASATLYGSIQRFVPMTWVEFYFHPTLNPLCESLPVILRLFIASVWLMLIVAVAVVEEMRRLPDVGDTLSYLTSLGGVCVVLYLVFTLSTPLIAGYFLLAAYAFFAIWQYAKHKPSHLLCGACGKSITKKGRCPYCGAENR